MKDAEHIKRCESAYQSMQKTARREISGGKSGSFNINLIKFFSVIINFENIKSQTWNTHEWYIYSSNIYKNNRIECQTFLKRWLRMFLRNPILIFNFISLFMLHASLNWATCVCVCCIVACVLFHLHATFYLSCCITDISLALITPAWNHNTIWWWFKKCKHKRNVGFDAHTCH